MPLTSSREKKCYTIRIFHRSQQNIFSYKGVVAISILEFDLVKKYSNNVKSVMIYVIIIKHAKFSDSSNASLCTSLRLQNPCTCSLLTPHIYNNFSIGGAFEIQLNICGGAFMWKQSTSLVCWLFLQRNSIVDVLKNSKCHCVQ